MNEVGELVDAGWWSTQERRPLLEKWLNLGEKRSNETLPADDPALMAVRRVSQERNRVAHFRGVPQEDGSIAVAGPPVTARGGISPVRAHFDAALARAVVVDAEAAFEAL